MIDAEINFAPICSNCGHIIFEEVNYTRDDVIYPDDRVTCIMKHTIVPRNCPKCGHIFTRITMPCKLPYTYENMKLKKATLSCKGCSYDDGAFHGLCTVCTRMVSDGEDDYYELIKESELKPCPFCGSEVEIEKIPLWYGNGRGYKDCYEFKIRCKKCGCRIDQTENDSIYRSEEKAKNNAIEAWNRRAKNDEKSV